MLKLGRAFVVKSHVVVSETDSNRVCLAKTGLALAAGLVLIFSSRPGFAQTAQDGGAGQPLPPVTVEAPERKSSAKTAPSAQSGARTAKRRVNRRPQIPQTAVTQAPAPTTTAQNAQSPYGPGVGYVATRSVTGTKTNTPILETPQSISVVTRDQMATQGVQTVSEALRYTPGITLNTFGVNSVFDTIWVRGFQVPLYLDGLILPVDSTTTFVTSRVVPYGLERIEVLRGPSSGLYGATPPGGLVNMISKRPTDTPQNEVGIQYGSFNERQAFFDTSGPADAKGEWLYRVVGLGRLSDTQIDFQQNNQYYVAPSVTWRPTAATSWTLLASVQEYSGNRGYQQYVPAIGSLLPNPNGRIPYSRFLGEPGQDYFRLPQQSIGWAFEHRFNDVLQFHQNIRFSNVNVDLLALRADGILPDLTTAPRSELYVFGNTKNFATDQGFQADIATGPVLHKALLGVDYYRTIADSGFNGARGTPINVFAPVYGTPQVPLSAMSPVVHAKTDLQQTGFYMQEQAKLDRWVLFLTGRADLVDNTNTNYLAVKTTDQFDSAKTWRAGLSYVFPIGLAPYILYSTSFQPLVGVNAQGQAFVPTTGKSKEIGIKYEPVGINALFTAALYDTTQQNVLTTDLANPLFSTQTGEVNVKGFEFEAHASISERLDVIGGYSRLFPKVTQSNMGNAGSYLPNVALETASLWAVYTMRDTIFAGWALGGGVRYTGNSYADNLNTIVIPPYTLFDAMVSYDFAYLSRQLRGLKFQLNVTNLANTYYVANCFGLTWCSLGAERTILATLKYQWPQDNRTLGQFAGLRTGIPAIDGR